MRWQLFGSNTFRHRSFIRRCWPLGTTTLYKSWHSFRTLMALLPFPVVRKQEHEQQLQHSCLSNALQFAVRRLISKQWTSQGKATAEQFGIAALAGKSRKNKSRLPGITSCVLSALTHTVKHAQFSRAKAVVLRSNLHYFASEDFTRQVLGPVWRHCSV